MENDKIISFIKAFLHATTPQGRQAKRAPKIKMFSIFSPLHLENFLK